MLKVVVAHYLIENSILTTLVRPHSTCVLHMHAHNFKIKYHDFKIKYPMVNYNTGAVYIAVIILSFPLTTLLE